MKTLRAHFDGKVLQLDEPADLPVNQPLEVEVRAVPAESSGESPLRRLARLAREFPADPDWPTDGAAQHDHYLYGTSPRP
jgi:hypothetical protein